MPDGLTHMAATAWTIPLWRDPRRRWVLYTGAILPDVVMKSMIWIFGASWTFAAPAHSLAGVALIAYVVAHLWEEHDRPAMFAALLTGGVLHLAVDALKDQHESWGPFLLYPFSRAEFALGLVAPEQAVLAIPVALAVVVLVEVHLRHADHAG